MGRDFYVAYFVIPEISKNNCKEADATLKDEQKSLDPFDDHMAAVHGSHISVTNKSFRWEFEAIDTVL